MADLVSLLEGVYWFNDNKRDPTRITEESLDRDLGRTRRRLAGWADDPNLYLRAGDPGPWATEAENDPAGVTNRGVGLAINTDDWDPRMALLSVSRRARCSAMAQSRTCSAALNRSCTATCSAR